MPTRLTYQIVEQSALLGPPFTIRNGERRQGRQRKRWEDNIREWTGLEFANSQKAVENMGKMEVTGCEIVCGVLNDPRG